MGLKIRSVTAELQCDRTTCRAKRVLTAPTQADVQAAARKAGWSLDRMHGHVEVLCPRHTRQRTELIEAGIFSADGHVLDAARYTQILDKEPRR